MVDPFHLGELNISIPRNYKVGQRLKARILFVDISSSKIYLSIKPSLLKMELYQVPRHISESAQYPKSVVKLKQADYLWISLSSNPPALAFVDSYHLSDKPIKRTEKFRIGTEHSCKVLGFNFIDGYPIGSLKKKLYNSLITNEDIVPGTTLDVIILQVSFFFFCRLLVHQKAQLSLKNKKGQQRWKHQSPNTRKNERANTLRTCCRYFALQRNSPDSCQIQAREKTKMSGCFVSF